MSYKKLTPAQKLIKSAINRDALRDALNDPEKKKEILRIINKVKY